VFPPLSVAASVTRPTTLPYTPGMAKKLLLLALLALLVFLGMKKAKG
jgi:hypothetical protein